MAQKVKYLLLLLVWIASSMQASDAESHFFKDLNLLYSDDFDGEFNNKWWQKRTKNWKIKEGALVGAPDYANEAKAMKALKRDHHLGLGPVIRFDHLPSQFVCEFKFQFTGEAILKGRPKLDIGHHINNLFFKEGGYALKLSGGKSFQNQDSKFQLNQWNTLVIEFMPGKLSIELNGQRQVFQDEQVSLKDRSEITFKALDGGTLQFDSIKLWEGVELQ